MFLQKRAEEYQPLVTWDFPHLVGLDRLDAWKSNTDPCDDFYKFACGQFIHKYSRNFDSIDILQLMGKANALLMESILKQPHDSLLDLDPQNTPASMEIFQKTKTYHDACADKTVIEERGFGPLEHMASGLIQSDASVSSLLGEMQSLGVYAFFKTSFGKVMDKDPNDLRLMFMPPSHYNVDKSVIRRVLQVYSDHGLLDPYALNALAISVFDIEETVGSHQFLNDHENQGQYTTLDQLSRRTGLDFNEYASRLKLEDAHRVFLWADCHEWLDYFRFIANLKEQELKVYFLWRLAVSHFNKLSSPYLQLWKQDIHPFILRPAYDDMTSTLDVFQDNCVTETGLHLKYLAGNLFIKYAFNETQKETATQLIDRLFGSFHDSLKNLDWMDSHSKTAAIQKLHNIVKIVGYPDWLSNPNLVAHYYRPLTFSLDRYFENAVQAQVFADLIPSIHSHRQHSLLKDAQYYGYPWQLNAFHLTDLVQIQVNSGILQRPLFSFKNPAAMNFGSIGMIIAHEITHGFDSIGSLVDPDGIKRPWMSQKSRTGFQERAQCFADQYSQFYLPLSNGKILQINGDRTLPENIADNAGLYIAYDALSKVLGDLLNEPLDNGMTSSQVFFTAYAQTWCSVRSDSYLEWMVKHDAHSPNQIRVNGAVSNSLEFSKAFNCPLGSRMNPLSKCSYF